MALRRYLKTPDDKHFEIDDQRVPGDVRPALDTWIRLGIAKLRPDLDVCGRQPRSAFVRAACVDVTPSARLAHLAGDL
jgi:hypothetical protein